MKYFKDLAEISQSNELEIPLGFNNDSDNYTKISVRSLLDTSSREKIVDEVKKFMNSIDDFKYSEYLKSQKVIKIESLISNFKNSFEKMINEKYSQAKEMIEDQKGKEFQEILKNWSN